MRIIESDSESEGGGDSVGTVTTMTALIGTGLAKQNGEPVGNAKIKSPSSPSKPAPLSVVYEDNASAVKYNGDSSKSKSPVRKPENNDGTDSDVPLAKLAAKSPAVKPAAGSKPGSPTAASPLITNVKLNVSGSPSPREKRAASYAAEEEESDDSDVLLSKFIIQKQLPSSSNGSPVVKKQPTKKKVKPMDSDNDSDVPLAKVAKKKAKQPANFDDSSDDSDVPLIQKAKKKATAGAGKAAVKKAGKRRLSDGSEDSKPVKLSRDSSGNGKRKMDGKKKPKESSPKKSENGEEDSAAEEQDESEFKWWENFNEDDGIKWTSLQHSGVYFPPTYQPHGVKMKYDGKPVELSPASEEVAGFFAQVLGTQYAENPTFCKNFFDDFKAVLRENDPTCPIKQFEKCDFSPMLEYFMQQKEVKKSMSKEEKERIKAEKKTIDDHYGWATIDGRREKIGNFRVEPPSLFRGRGDHPKTGKLKLRVMPEQITINIGEDAKVPEPPTGHKWGGVIHDNTVSWLATWTENVNGNIKYVFFAANSSLKGMSDLKKFEKARELKKHIQKIRQDYMAELKDKVMMVRQRATAMWLIDKLALRAGNEKGEDEADTVGCCSLRFEHVQLEEDQCEIMDSETGEKKIISKKMVVFDFLGKDSIRYYNRVQVDPVVWKNLKIFRREPKKEGDPIFDRLNTSILNKHLTALMPGLTAKVFRTYNASYTFQEELKKTPTDAPVTEKCLAYNRSNRQVAILCNHQRTVSKAHGTQMEKLDERILALKYDRYLVRQKLLEADPKVKKRMPEVAEEESDMDEETIERKKMDKEQLEAERLEKRYQKMCEKAETEGKPKPEKPEPVDSDSRDVSIDRLEKQYSTLTAKIQNMKAMRTDKDENKTTALGTSKINYIDPRITSAWCKKYSVPVEKMFNKSLREKFKWAMDVDADWTF